MFDNLRRSRRASSTSEADVIRTLPIADEMHGVNPQDLPRDIELAEREFSELALAARRLLECLDADSSGADADEGVDMEKFEKAIGDEGVKFHLARAVLAHEGQKSPAEPSTQD